LQIRFANRFHPTCRNQRLQVIPENSPGLIARGSTGEITAGLPISCWAYQMFRQSPFGKFCFSAAPPGWDDFKSRVALPERELNWMRP
jgi:hypothetical protein